MTDKTKLILWVIGIAIVVYIWNFEPEVIRGLFRTGGKVLGIGFGLLMVVLAGAGIWVGVVKGENDGASAPVDNPGSVGNRGAALFLSLIQLAIGVGSLMWAFGFAD